MEIVGQGLDPKVIFYMNLVFLFLNNRDEKESPVVKGSCLDVSVDLALEVLPTGHRL